MTLIPRCLRRGGSFLEISLETDHEPFLKPSHPGKRIYSHHFSSNETMKLPSGESLPRRELFCFPAGYNFKFGGKRRRKKAKGFINLKPLNFQEGGSNDQQK
jgi:hypothetical protein